jgi:hypothetical protein
VATPPPRSDPTGSPRDAAVAAPVVRINQPNFSGASAMSVNGSAARSGTVLRLTDTGQGEAGSAWSTARLDPARSFATFFRLSLQGSGADGVAFVIQTEGPGAIGRSGGGLGYGDLVGASPRIAVSPSVDIEFDTYGNPWDPDYYHIAVTTNGRMQTPLVTRPSFDLVCAPFAVWIYYDGPTHVLQIYASQSTTRPDAPVLAVTLDIARVVGAGPAWVGFTGSTGLWTANQDVLAWQLTQ